LIVTDQVYNLRILFADTKNRNQRHAICRPKTPALEPNEVDLMTVWPLEISQDVGRPPSRDVIGHVTIGSTDPEYPIPRTKPEVDRTSGCWVYGHLKFSRKWCRSVVNVHYTDVIYSFSLR